MIAIVPLIAVYVAFAAKQLLADYYFQTEWMVFGKGSKDEWFAPLATHAGVHAALTLAIVLVVRPSLWWLAVADFVIHVAIDRGKAMVSRRLALTPKDTGFWWAIGTDQTLHQLTHFAYVILLVRPM